jgi:hypothetical protein
MNPTRFGGAVLFGMEAQSNRRTSEDFFAYHLQLLSEIGKRPELLSASCTDLRGELVGWFVFIRHRATPALIARAA